MKTVHGFPEMTEQMKAELEALAKLPDDQIDTSDIPEWTAEDFAQAVPFSSLYRPRKEQITARLDADVLAWLKAQHRTGFASITNPTKTTLPPSKTTPKGQ